MKERLTDESFWNQYWENCNIPNIINENFSFERCLARTLRKILKLDLKYKTVFEIGCAPGKWLAFFAHEFGMIPYGIDYSTAGIKAAKRNFSSLGLNILGLQNSDFLKEKPNKLHDVVVSFGFIEHFENPNFIIEKHLTWLKPGGLLILGVPNFRGIYYPIQKILSPRILKSHNLNIMNLEYFRALANIFNLKIITTTYLGSFEPCLFIDEQTNPKLHHKIINLSLQALKKLRRATIFDYINNKWVSSYILGVYQKNHE